MSHTPGPWRISSCPGDDGWYPGIRNDRFVWVLDDRGFQCDADKALIAAAPDLLAALEEIVRASDNEELTSEHFAEARLICKKARGE